MKVVAAMSMWELCMERGHRDLEQFEKVHRFISDQLFTHFVSHGPAPFPRRGFLPSQGSLKRQLTQKSLPETRVTSSGVLR